MYVWTYVLMCPFLSHTLAMHFMRLYVVLIQDVCIQILCLGVIMGRMWAVSEMEIRPDLFSKKWTSVPMTYECHPQVGWALNINN